jgi:hypothetical protein
MQEPKEDVIARRQARKAKPETIHVISPVVTNGFVTSYEAGDNLLSLFYNLPGELMLVAFKLVRKDGEELQSKIGVSFREYVDGEQNTLVKTLKEPFEIIKLNKMVSPRATFLITLDGVVSMGDSCPLVGGLMVWTSALFYPHSTSCRKERR